MDIRNYFKNDSNNLDEESDKKLVLYEKSLKVYEVFTDGSSPKQWNEIKITIWRYRSFLQ